MKISAKLSGDIRKELAEKIAKDGDDSIGRLVAALRRATPVDTGRAASGWRKDGNSIRNDVEYLSNLNAGASRQAPAHFVERSLLLNGAYPNGTIVRPAR